MLPSFELQESQRGQLAKQKKMLADRLGRAEAEEGPWKLLQENVCLILFCEREVDRFRGALNAKVS